MEEKLSNLLTELQKTIGHIELYSRAIGQMQYGYFDRSLHIAIMVEPYLTRTLKGLKTIESRFAKNRIVPCKTGSIKNGDIVLIKQSGGNIKGICRVDKIWQWSGRGDKYGKILTNSRNNSEEYIDTFVAKNASGLQYEPDFYESVKGKPYCAFIALENLVTGLEVPYKQSGQAGWIKLNKDQDKLF